MSIYIVAVMEYISADILKVSMLVFVVFCVSSIFLNCTDFITLDMSFSMRSVGNHHPF